MKNIETEIEALEKRLFVLRNIKKETELPFAHLAPCCPACGKHIMPHQNVTHYYKIDNPTYVGKYECTGEFIVDDHKTSDPHDPHTCQAQQQG